jgi:hypothetical protein
LRVPVVRSTSQCMRCASRAELATRRTDRTGKPGAAVPPPPPAHSPQRVGSRTGRHHGMVHTTILCGPRARTKTQLATPSPIEPPHPRTTHPACHSPREVTCRVGGVRAYRHTSRKARQRNTIRLRVLSWRPAARRALLKAPANTSPRAISTSGCPRRYNELTARTKGFGTLDPGSPGPRRPDNPCGWSCARRFRARGARRAGPTLPPRCRGPACACSGRATAPRP